MSTCSAFLRLVRIPAVFTAMADILLGYLLQHSSYSPLLQLVMLLIASSCLYMAGMALNDIFDRHRDAITRPNRPIPSGQVSVRSAVITSVLLLAIGLLAAGIVSMSSLTIAGLLIVAIFAYNGAMKATFAGPGVMGACRFLNVMLGASVNGDWSTAWAAPQLWIAAGIAIYIAGVTFFAKREAEEPRARDLAMATVVCDTGLALLAVCVYSWPGSSVLARW